MSQWSVRAAVLFLLAAAGVPTSARAEPVTVRVSGLLTEWFTSPLAQPVPSVLTEALPPGTPFTASFTYDPSLPATVLDIRGHTVYRGVLTDLSLETAAHTISRNAAASFPTQTWVSNNHLELGGGDGLAGDSRAVIDGNSTFEGVQVISANVALIDAAGLALSSQELPTRVCLGAWPAARFQGQLRADGVFYFVNGVGAPDRTIDSDGDTLSDGAEITLGTDACRIDTDGDGLADNVDPNPLVPSLSNSQLAERVRGSALGVLDTPEGAFAGPNGNAQRGRRNALANRLQAAANEIEAGNLEEGLQILLNVRRLVDGDPTPPDVLVPGPERDALRAQIDALIALVREALGE